MAENNRKMELAQKQLVSRSLCYRVNVMTFLNALVLVLMNDYHYFIFIYYDGIYLPRG